MSKRQSCSKKNEPERLIETPNGEGQRVCSRADSLDSSENSKKHRETTGAHFPQEARERQPSIMNVSHQSDEPKSPSSREETNDSGQRAIEDCEYLGKFLSLGSGGVPIIGETSALWRNELFKSGFSSVRVLKIKSAYGRKLSFNGNGGGSGGGVIVEVFLLEVEDSMNPFVFLLVASPNGRKGRVKYDLHLFKNFSGVKRDVYLKNNSSLEVYAVDCLNKWFRGRETKLPRLKVKDLLENSLAYRYNFFYEEQLGWGR